MTEAREPVIRLTPSQGRERGAQEFEVTADAAVCCGAGHCAVVAPAVFDQDAATGLVKLLDPHPPPTQFLNVQEAEELCPSGAIRLSIR